MPDYYSDFYNLPWIETGLTASAGTGLSVSITPGIAWIPNAAQATPRESWTPTTSYNANDIVTVGAAFYVCTTANTNQQPPNTAYWQPLTPAGQGNTGSRQSLPAAITVTVPASSSVYIDWNGQAFMTTTATTALSGWVRLASVVTGSSTVSSVTDLRPSSSVSSPQRPYMYLPSGWDAGWKAAKSKVSTQPVVVASFGDSLSVGVNSTYAGSYSEQILSALSTTYGAYGDHWPSTYGYLGPFGPWSAAQNGAAALTVFTSNSIGFGEFFYTSAVAANYYQRFTAPYACTALDFLYHDSYAAAASTWGYSVDGASSTTVTNASVNYTKRISISGLSNTTHTFDWGWQSVNAACASVGLCAYRPGATSGIFGARFGHSGAATNNTLAASMFAGQTSFSGYPLGAQLAIYELVTNDVNQNVAVATFTQNITQTIRALRRSSPNCSVVFLLPSYPDGTVDDCTPASFSNNAISFTWHQAIYQVAQRLNCAVVDMHAKWGSNPAGKGFLNTTNLHPLTAGQNDIYAQVMSIL